ncbi:MAG TPA: hypothetical protein VH231_18780 [Solirubrobacteraceae bacterium]|nr:hypothetical protein [Solirubrobacteraceae bacterium]
MIAAETDWGTVAEVGTAVGTLVLAIATFLATRTANRASRVAEQALLISLRPVLVPSREGDPSDTVLWGDGHQIVLPGGFAWAEVRGDNVYLAISLRNVGAGLGALRAWCVYPQRIRTITDDAAPSNVDDFTQQVRDLYVPPGDASFWQASLRAHDETLHSDEDLRRAVRGALIQQADGITIDLLYSDGEGGQPTVSRFSLLPRGADEEGDPALHIPTVVRHWRV